MRKVFITGLLIVCCLKGFSRDPKLIFDINEPITVGDNFIGKNYYGIFDSGLKYNLIELGKLKLGVSTNVGLLKSDHFPYSVNVLMIKPRIDAEIDFGRFTPYTGIGYSFFNFDIDNNPESHMANDGLNFNLGLRFRIISTVYLNLNFDVIDFRTDNVPNTSYNRNINIFEIGAGIKI